MLLRDVKIFSWEVIMKKVCILNYIMISRGFQDVRTLLF